MKIYVTTGGEMLDEICHAHYGSESMITEVYRANNGLEFQPFILPEGLEIKLPAKKEEEKKRVTLW